MSDEHVSKKGKRLHHKYQRKLVRQMLRDSDSSTDTPPACFPISDDSSSICKRERKAEDGESSARHSVQIRRRDAARKEGARIGEYRRLHGFDPYWVKFMNSLHQEECRRRAGGAASSSAFEFDETKPTELTAEDFALFGL